jgi:hypothetical protein
LGTHVTYRGRVYALGFDAASFAIWSLNGGEPIARFDRTEEGWRRAWIRFQQLDRAEGAAWRRRTAPWILMNVCLSVALWFLVVVVEGIALWLASRDVEELTTMSGVGVFVALPLSIAGWMLFAYASSAASRRLALLILIGGAFVVAVITGVVGQPAE